MIELWELAGADRARRFSPYCWRIRMALRHKGLDFQAHPWSFIDKDKIAFSGQGLVPVIKDGDSVVSDSWAIAEYLDDKYPDRPSVFGPQGRGLSRFATEWADTTVAPPLMGMIAIDIYNVLDEGSRPYFRETREKRLGIVLEQTGERREAKREMWRKAINPMRRTVARQPFLAGDTPGWADFAAFGFFQWARCVSPFPLLEPDDAVYAWRERMLDAYDGEARKAVGFPVGP